MASAESHWPFRERALDVAWALFAVANLVAMVAFPTWETVPFHFIWVSLTIVYGFRVWRTTGTGWVLGAVMGLTGLVLWHDVAGGDQPLDELTEVPLMASMFVAMVWHARRRLTATHEVERVSDDNRRLLEREKRFVQDASHHLRTPITIALGHAELLARSADADGRDAEDAHVVVDELQRLRRLADHLLRIVSAEESRPVERTEVHLDVMLAETLQRWTAVPRVWTLGELEGVTVLGDADQLRLAVDELVQNAVSHTAPGDEITLSVRVVDGSALVSVADTGTGIRGRDLDRIFERFAQSENGDRASGGLGLGLSFVKSVAESHGGRASVRSAVGRGSVFELSIPALAPGRMSAPPRRDARAAGAAAGS